MVELAMRVSLLLLLPVLTASAKSINPAVKRIVDAVSEERIAATDTFANTSPGYAGRVVRINAAALASLAPAPKAPVVTREVKSGEYKGLFVGNVNEYSFEDVSIDDLVFGVKAIDKDGNESLVSVYADTPRPKARD